MGAARTRLRRSWERRVRVRPTRQGLAFGLLLLGVLAAAVNTGNNLLYLVLAGQLSVLLLSNLLAEWNLRGIAVRRRLPVEAYAGQDAAGAWLLTNRRRWGAGWSLRVAEVEAPRPPWWLRERDELRAPTDLPEGEAGAALAWLAPGEQATVPARWRMPSRGLARLGAVRLSSTFPFGLVERYRDFPAPAELLVYPAQASGPTARAAVSGGATRHHPHRRGRGGDFQGLRSYEPGDSLRDLHWPTSARTGRPMVVVRTAEAADQVLVEVDPAQGARWEANLARACGQVVRHFRAGHAVGLAIGGEVLRPRTGDSWRRHLLSRLALAPGDGGGLR